MTLARLDEQPAVVRQPTGRWLGDQSNDVESVGTAVECRPWLVHARLRGQQADRRGGYVGRVGQEEVDPTSQSSRQRVVQITFVHLAAARRDIAPGAAHRGRVDIHGVQLDIVQPLSQGSPHGARAAAEIDDDGPRPGNGGRSADGVGGLANEELGPTSRYEHCLLESDPQPAELGPSDDVLER